MLAVAVAVLMLVMGDLAVLEVAVLVAEAQVAPLTKERLEQLTLVAAVAVVDIAELVVELEVQV
jgi:hypothetical protein